MHRYIKERKARNPLQCEKTPRTDFQKDKYWDYSIPPGETFPDKWNYATEYRPLLEQFGSLQEKVKKDEDMVRAHNARIKAFQDSQATQPQQSSRLSCRETARDSSRSTGRGSARETARETGRSCSETHRDADASTARFSQRSDNPFGSGRSTSRSEKDLTSFAPSTLKSLQHDHPEILAKMRAQRAVKYVSSIANPLDPPSYNSISSRKSFFPAGTNSLHHEKEEAKTRHKKHSGKIVLTSRNVDTSRMKESLNSLVDELEKTDSQIQRQELKIALAPKVKTYDKSRRKV